MKKINLVVLFLFATFLLQAQTNPTSTSSSRSTSNGYDWEITSGYGSYCGSSYITLDGSGDGHGGSIIIGAGGGMGSNGKIKLETSSGYVRIGPENASYCHFITDRSRFYFNKEIRVNSGLIGSYDESLQLRVSGSTKMYLNSSGKVGIGTTSPSAILHVKSSAQTTALIEHSTTSDWNYAFKVKTNHDKTKAIAVQNSSGEDLFLVWGNGVVNTKTLYAEEIEVKVSAIPTYWPDYVFNDNYKLKDLNDVKKYVEENNHLPGIPSEKEVLENGINLGEMNAKLLMKIEELTLYIINQNQKIEEQKQILNELKDEVTFLKNN